LPTHVKAKNAIRLDGESKLGGRPQRLLCKKNNALLQVRAVFDRGLFEIAAGPVIARLRGNAERAAVASFREHANLGVEFQLSTLVRTLLSAANRLEWQVDRLKQSRGAMGRDIRSLFAMLNVTGL
jgi:hypothetical protein